MKILQRYTITTDDHRMRTRFTFFENMVRIDTLVVSDRKIEGNDEGAHQGVFRELAGNDPEAGRRENQ